MGCCPPTGAWSWVVEGKGRGRLGPIEGWPIPRCAQPKAVCSGELSTRRWLGAGSGHRPGPVANPLLHTAKSCTQWGSWVNMIKKT